jgi:RES domain-containing protein
VITAWRIVSAAFASNAFDGEGARIYGGRWNSRGHRAVYTSSSASLATLELLVWMRERETMEPYVLFACSFPDSLVLPLDRTSLPDDWRAHPSPMSLKRLGDEWLTAGRSAALSVPSAVIETELNYLLNPAHRDFAKIEIAEPVPFSLDLRLLRR